MTLTLKKKEMNMLPVVTEICFTNSCIFITSQYVVTTPGDICLDSHQNHVVTVNLEYRGGPCLFPFLCFVVVLRKRVNV